MTVEIKRGNIDGKLYIGEVISESGSYLAVIRCIEGDGAEEILTHECSSIKEGENLILDAWGDLIENAFEID